MPNGSAEWLKFQLSLDSLFLSLSTQETSNILWTTSALVFKSGLFNLSRQCDSKENHKAAIDPTLYSLLKLAKIPLPL